MRIHNDERPFTCSICGRGFREKKVMKKHEALHTSERPYKCSVCGKGFLRQSNLELHSVMHQKERDGALLVRPRPKTKKKPDAQMRDFVASVLLNVKKVDSSMQTDSLVNGVPSAEVCVTDGLTDANNLSGFVNDAIGQGTHSGIKVEPISTLQNVNGEEQYTLVLQDGGEEGYFMPGYDQGTASEEIVSLPAQQVEITTMYKAVTGDPGMSAEPPSFTSSEEDTALRALENATSSSNEIVVKIEASGDIELHSALEQTAENVDSTNVSIPDHTYEMVKTD